MTDETEPTPAEVVARQVEAYNDGDAEAFAAYYAEDAVVADLADGERIADGRAAIREQWGELFEANPDLHCEVTDELTLGPFVVDRERLTGMGGEAEALAVYRVEGDVIQRVWLGQV